MYRGRRNCNKYAKNIGCHCMNVRCVASIHFCFEFIVKMTVIRLVAVSKVRCQFNSHLRTLLHELWVWNIMNFLQLKVFNKFKNFYNFSLNHLYFVELNVVLLELSESSCTI
jgi:hypothetical protein